MNRRTEFLRSGPSVGEDNSLLLNELAQMLKTDHGRRRLLKALPDIAVTYLDSPAAVRTLILRTMPYKQYLRTIHWRTTSEAAKSRAGRRCQMCNSPDNLETHHRTYERRGCEDDLDLTVLCDRCHEKFHKEPPQEDVDSTPKLTEEQEAQWLNELVVKRRQEMGIPAETYHD